jgi:hypothetical protein
MEREVALFLRDQLKDARSIILRDAESYDSVVHVLERIGRLCTENGEGLDRFKPAIINLANSSPLSMDVPAALPHYHLSFDTLFELVRDARNAAVHEGALARHLTGHALEVALVLEDALMTDASTVADFMVRSPAIAMPWHPLSFVRQAMLMNSFSYLPVHMCTAGSRCWHVISDVAIASYLRGAPSKSIRNERLKMSLRDAHREQGIELALPQYARPEQPINEVLGDLTSLPLLVLGSNSDELLGIVTAFDLL